MNFDCLSSGGGRQEAEMQETHLCPREGARHFRGLMFQDMEGYYCSPGLRGR